MTSSSLALALLATILAQPPGASVTDAPLYRIEAPGLALRNVPVDAVIVTRDGPDWKPSRPLELSGVRLEIEGQPAEIPTFAGASLELTTDLAEGRKLFIDSPEIVLRDGEQVVNQVSVRLLSGWLSLVPPLMAIGLAILLRNVILALFLAIFSGVLLFTAGHPLEAFFVTLDDYILGELVEPGSDSHSHMLIILFTLALGAMIAIMSRSGGTAALVQRLARFTSTRRSGQTMTWALGLVIFFDDYANTFLVGTTMRPVTDRLKISREKLAFLIDATAAPVAGLAIVSTWVGVEVGYIASTYEDLQMSGDVYVTFLRTLPYRFYPIYLLAFVLMIARTGRDFGPMRKAEERALSAVPAVDESPDSGPNPGAREGKVINAALPLVALVLLITIGLWTTGVAGLAETNEALRLAGDEEIAASLSSVLEYSNPNQVLFYSAFAASLLAGLCALVTRALSLAEATEAWIDGTRSMLMAVLILVLAWGVATLCNADHLNTAGYLVELSRGNLAPPWMPALAFVVAAAVSFATGSSWSTMGLLMPLFISVTYYLLVDAGTSVGPNDALMLGTIGSVLAGAIFGDHCSPISDTTVLSSAASECDHIAHVTTQMPYALVVGVVSIVCGYVPAGFGLSPYVCLPLGLVVLYGITRLGRDPERTAAS